MFLSSLSVESIIAHMSEKEKKNPFHFHRRRLFSGNKFPISKNRTFSGRKHRQFRVKPMSFAQNRRKENKIKKFEKNP